MGLSNNLHDLSADSLPILFVAAAARCVAYLGSLLIFLAGHLSAFPSSPSAVHCLPECVVCLSPLADGGRVRRLGCRHVFHAECIDGWFVQKMNLSCPLCRAPLGLYG